jgi:hypothetical protein
METEGIYKPMGQSIASDCLKIVEIKCVYVDRSVHKILKILTSYGIRLEQINIQHTNKISGSGCELALFMLLLFLYFVNMFHAF